MPPRRIFLLTTVMTTGGVQKAIMQLARGLADRGHQVIVAAMYDKTGAIPAYEADFDLPITDLEMNPSGSRVRKVVAMLRGGARLWRTVRERKVEVLQSFTHYSNILGPFVGVIAGVPVRVTSQRTPLDDRSPWLRRADRWVSRSGLAHRMVAASEYLRSYCMDREGLHPGRVVTIRNGVDPMYGSAEARSRRAATRSALGLEPDHVGILTVARLSREKGLESLLEAATSLAARRPEARFLWVGDGELRDDLELRVRQHELADRILILRDRRDVPELLGASDLFVLPSLSEGMPNAVLEAMAAGLPVVATSVGGTPEAVIEGETGWLVPPGDPAALARAIGAALDDPDARARLGEAGRRRVQESFSLASYVGGFEDLYEELLESHG
jgi:L-malate glycosyltransferase